MTAVEAVVLDADDTLWHNEPFFGRALSEAHDLLSPHVDSSAFDERFRQIEHGNLSLYGYGVKGFTLSLIEAAIETCGPAARPSLIAELLAIGRDMLRHPVTLLPGVEETLTALYGSRPLYLLTKGDLVHQEAKIAASGLGSFFAATRVVADKTPETYHRLFVDFGLTAERVLVAGNSMRSDVLPALEAGASAALIPYEVVWAHEAGEEPSDHARYFKLARISELPSLLASLDGRHPTRHHPTQHHAAPHPLEHPPERSEGLE